MQWPPLSSSSDDDLCPNHRRIGLLLTGGSLSETRYPYPPWKRGDLRRRALTCEFCAFVLRLWDDRHARLGRRAEDGSGEAAVRATLVPFAQKWEVVAWRWFYRLDLDLVQGVHGEEEGAREGEEDGATKLSVYRRADDDEGEGEGAEDDMTAPPPGELFRARTIRADRFNVDRVRGWISKCHGWHGESCAPAPRVSLPAHFRAIDVHRACVVEGPPLDEYVALSYVWGRRAQVQLTEETWPSLHADGALLDGALRVARTIEDAILLCRELGQRWLWVDALCIRQDDEVDREEQIACMDTIYSGASLTIVGAAGGDSNAGLPAFGQPSRTHRRRRRQHSVTTAAGIPLLSSLRDPLEMAQRSIWSSRAWTFQEFELSRRRLVFTHDGAVLFVCCKASWRDDLVAETPEAFPSVVLGRSQKDSIHARPRAPDHVYGQYTSVLASYIHRQMALDGDVLNACRGILNVLDDIAPYRWGVPERRFAETLIWCPKLEVRRHTDYHAPPGPYNVERRAGFPSWSWAGWKFRGSVYLNFDPACSNGFTASALFYMIDEQGSAVLLGRHQQQQPPPPRPRGCTHEEIIQALTPIPHALRPQLLFFRAFSVHLHVDYDGTTSTDRRYYRVGPSRGGFYGYIVLAHEWRRRQPQALEFIKIGESTSSGPLSRAYLVGIDWVDGVAYRVGLLEVDNSVGATGAIPLTREEFLCCDPTEKLIVWG